MTKFKRLASIAMVGCIMGSMLEMNANAVNVALTENNEASSTSIITIFEYEKALQEAGNHTELKSKFWIIIRTLN